MGDKYDQCLENLRFQLAVLLFPDTPITKIQLELVGAWMEKKYINDSIKELNPEYGLVKG